MVPQVASYGAADEAVMHGGDLAAARLLFPDAPEPFIDLSTGINPNSYRLPRFSPDLFAHLPDADAAAALVQAAARVYGAPSAACVAAAPGTQILLPLVAALVRPGRAAVLTPSYPEHARAAALAGHRVQAVREIDAAGEASLVIVGNPNNPDGRLFTEDELLAFADKISPRGGLLVVDEAFMDVAPPGLSLAADVSRGNIVVLRSFGKFFGLAGLRLGFALAAPALAKKLSAALGPWAVSGPAQAVGVKALGDDAWIERTRERLTRTANKLDSILIGAGLDVVGGTSLFRLAQTPAAEALFEHLGRAGILTRRFPENADWLRFGLPANEPAWRRLGTALGAISGKRIRAVNERAGKAVVRTHRRLGKVVDGIR
jgi:cobalamin biosynthetic protein CobC